MKKLKFFLLTIIVFSCISLSGCFFKSCSNNLYPEITEPRDFEFSLIDNGMAYEVTVGEITKSGITEIPAMYNNLPVTSIGTFAFYNCVTLIKVIIPEGISTIGHSAFYNCKSLMEIEIPASVTALGDTYIDMSKIESANISFGDTANMPSLLTPPTPPPLEGIFRNCINLTSITFADGSLLECIGDFAFINCEKLTEIEILNTVEVIGNYAFSGCTSLSEVQIPESVICIGDYLFENCTNLSSISFAENSRLKNISKAMFHSCEKLIAIEIPSSVTIIDHDIFFNCPSLTNLTMENGSNKFRSENNCIILAEENELVLGCKSSIIPYGVVAIGERAFSGSNLTNIKLPSSIKKIGESAFYNNRDLIEIFIPDSGITKIENSTFYECRTLKEIILPLSVKEIGQFAFYNCISLKGAEINGVTTIDSSAFNRCSALSEFVLPEGLITIGDSAFYGCSSLTIINIPSSVKSIGNSAFVWCDNIKELTISNDVKDLVIGVYSLSGCKLVKSIVIPYGVVSIESNAFAHCWELRQIQISASVTKMGSHVFTGCHDLKIYVKASSKPSGWDEKWNSDDSSSSGAERTRKVIWGY